MVNRAKALFSGLHFRFLSLVFGVAFVLLTVLSAADTLSELYKQRSARLLDALSVTNVIARTLEKQFDIIELDDIEEILSSVRRRADVLQLSVVDADFSFYLDGDPVTSPIAAYNYSSVQIEALKTGKTAYEVGNARIEVGEPLLGRDRPVGAVMIAFNNPSFWEMAMPVVRAKLVMLVPILAMGLLFAARMVSQTTAPLSALSASAKRIAEGDFEGRVDEIGAREVRTLARSFNQMVSTIKSNIAQIYDLAYIDRVTNLPNREYFRKELTSAIYNSLRNQSAGALLFVDIDGFKRVNDTFGHDFGDRILGLFAGRVTEILRQSDSQSLERAWEQNRAPAEAREQVRLNSFSRLGGDEFTILLDEIRSEDDAALVAERIISAMQEPFLVNETEVQLGASIGISFFPRDGEDFQTILRHADMAMYQAKDSGKNTWRFFSRELNLQASERMEIETELRKALAERKLELFYQPKLAVDGIHVHGAEALIRWRHPERGFMNPGVFIPIAENTGLIHPLGQFVLETACARIRGLQNEGRRVPIAVNVSVQQFEKPDFAATVKAVLAASGADPHLLELEVTESMAMSSPEIALAHMIELREIGVRFSVDDFGTGYSNLAQLSRMPFDVLKIDRSFVKRIDSGEGEQAMAMVNTVIAMARSLGFQTVAEGVETAEQLEMLREAGCDIIQGFLFAKPMPDGDFIAWLDKDRAAEVAAATSVRAA